MLRAGDVLAGRYRLESRAGGGGMGDVWLGEDILLNRTVAVKVLLAKLAEEEDFRERFRREACAIAALESPNIVDVYDYGEVGSARGTLAFLVMPYIDAPPLSRRLAYAGRLGATETLEIIAQVADGLHVAHTAGIIHRDIKPGNILVRDNGHVTLVDFGIARRSGNLTMTTTGVVLGTVTYMSPEQASGERLTPASDIYSLGVVAYQCLVGNPPFKADTPLGVLSAHLRDAPPRLPTEIPEPVPDLIVRALDKDPSDRWNDAGEFAEACREAARPAPPGAVPATTSAAAPPPQVRQPHFPSDTPLSGDDGPAVTANETKRRPGRRAVVLLGVVALVAMLLATAAAMRPWEVQQLVDVTGGSSIPGASTDTAGITDQDGAPGEGEQVDAEPTSSEAASKSESGSPSATTESSVSPSSSASTPGPETVPDVLRLSESQARRTLDGAGFRPAVDYQGDGDNSCEVVSQQPEAGHEAEPGSTVIITVSRGDVCAGG